MKHVQVLCRVLFLLAIPAILMQSCKESEKAKIERLVKEWNGKQIVYPDQLTFSVLGNELPGFVPTHLDYSIISYADPTGCVECNLQLGKWQEYIEELKSLCADSIPVLFFFHAHRKGDVVSILKRSKFRYPVCLDMDDRMNKLNHFPEERAFQTFLLDKQHQVVAIGNPVHNPQIKELYLKIILGDKAPQRLPAGKTQVVVEATTVNLGKFNWKKEQSVHFTLTNTGRSPLVIEQVNTSCGCTTVEYGKEPVQPQESQDICVNYKADVRGFFNKTITVYCNTENSPIKLEITGNAEEWN